MKKLFASKRAITKVQAAIIVVVLIAVVAAAGVYYYYATLPPPKEILIGVSLSLTGKYAESARWYVEGYDLWVKDVNARGGLLGRPVKLIYMDDRSDPTTGVANYERLITVDKVDLIFGSYASAIVFSTSTVAEKYGYLYVEGGGSALKIFTRGYKYVFLTLPGISQVYSQGFYEFLEKLPAEKKPKTFAFICEDTLFPVSTTIGGIAYTIGGVKNFDKVLEWLGPVEKVTMATIEEVRRRVETELGYRSPFEVVFFEKYAKGTTDLTPIVTKIKALNADVFYIGGYFPDSVMGVRAAKELDYNPMGIFATVGPSMPEFGESLKKDAMYVWCGVHFHHMCPWAAEFVEKYEKEWGRKPDYHAAGAYVVGQIIEAAVKATGTLDNEKLRDWIATHNSPENALPNVAGPLYWDERGVPGYGMITIQWLDIPGKRGLADYIIMPESAREVEPVWPMPTWAER